MAKSPTKYSKKAIKWLNYCQNQTPFMDGSNLNIIHHALNSGEKEFKTSTVKFHADGYAEINGVQHFLFFHGCCFHQCPNCGKSAGSPFLTPSKVKSDIEVENYCRKQGVYHRIFECQWDQLMKSGVKYKNFTSQFFEKNNIEETDLVEAVKDGSLYGFIQADLTSPDHVIEKYRQVNFPIIFNHVIVEDDMINPSILENLKKKKTDYSNKQLTLTFHAKSYLMTTDLCQWYMEQGVEISNVTLVVEYIKYQPFKKFINELAECRKVADQNGQSDLAAIFKLLANATYGSLALDRAKVSRQLKYRIINKYYYYYNYYFSIVT